MHTTRWTAVAVALGIALAAIATTTNGAAPANAATCRGERITVAQLASGCAVGSGTVVLGDGRVFAVPAAGMTVTAAPVAAAGATDPGDVSIANKGSAGVAVLVDDVWSGSAAAVRHERAALSQRIRAATVARPLAATTAAKATSSSCTSKAYTALGYRWNSTVKWSYNAANQKLSGVSAIGAGATAWTGAVKSCGKSIVSGADDAYQGTTTQAMGVTASGGCGASSGTSVVGWGSLPSRVLAVTCVWSRAGVAVEVDQRYTTGQNWSASAACSGARYDLRGVATHEWGHAYGLGHTAQSTGLVMKPASGQCDTAQRGLGLGDVLGIAAVG